MAVVARIGDWDFEHASYDRDADVLYLCIKEPKPGFSEETPEGHVLRFTKGGKFNGITLIGVRKAFTSEGKLDITLPHKEHVKPKDLGRALV